MSDGLSAPFAPAGQRQNARVPSACTLPQTWSAPEVSLTKTPFEPITGDSPKGRLLAPLFPGWAVATKLRRGAGTGSPLPGPPWVLGPKRRHQAWAWKRLPSKGSLGPSGDIVTSFCRRTGPREQWTHGARGRPWHVLNAQGRVHVFRSGQQPQGSDSFWVLVLSCCRALQRRSRQTSK